MTRSNLFDFAWNQKAAIKAGVLADQGHFEPWWIDMLYTICDGWLSAEQLPRALRGWWPTQVPTRSLPPRASHAASS